MTQSKNSVSALELKRQLGVTYKTAWLLKHKLLQTMLLREEPRRLDARVEIDSVLENLTKNAPAGSETAVAAFKNALTSGQNAFESAQAQAKKAVETAQANFTAAATQTADAVKKATKVA